LNKIWKLKDLYPENGEKPQNDIDSFIKEMQSLNTRVQIPELIIRLLFIRGITSYPKVLRFFRPTIDKLYDPFLMKDCDKAADRIIKALNDKEKIMVLTDYDVDGTCGASMFYLFLKHFALESLVYIPDRITEGYGISEIAIDKAKEENIKLIVSIDCGITAYDKIEYARSLGIEFIICDHHQPPEKIPEALAVLDPMRKDCNYPYKYLCGTGVAFKLIQAVCTKLSQEDFAYTLLDFVALATSSDIVPIVDENRILVNEGFKMINSKPRPSIKTLIDSIGFRSQKITTSNIVFSIAPRINAVGRLGDAKRAVELLTSDDENELKELAYTLNTENTSRRELDKTITEIAYKIHEENNTGNDCFSIVLHNTDWHPGVIGIVAARLVEKYNLPSIVLTTVNGVAKGSARSINGFNIYNALKRCENMLIQFGGHYHAAGLEIELDKLEEFRKEFNKLAADELSEKQIKPEIEVDAKMEFKDITPQFIKMLSFFEPFGPANMTPLFTTDNVQIVGEVRYAKSNTHLFKVRDRESKKIFDTVFFSSAEYHEKILTGAKCNICYSIDKSVWNGNTTYKLRIRDMEF
jgi:single-stranded-DNA-specific exonuclease